MYCDNTIIRCTCTGSSKSTMEGCYVILSFTVVQVLWKDAM